MHKCTKIYCGPCESLKASLKANSRIMESQVGKQDQVNQDLQRQMRTLVESFRKLEQKLAAQQAKLDDAVGTDRPIRDAGHNVPDPSQPR